MKFVDQPVTVAEVDSSVAKPRRLHLVGSLPRQVAATELAAMEWVLKHLVPPEKGGRGDGRPAVA